MTNRTCLLLLLSWTTLACVIIPVTAERRCFYVNEATATGASPTQTQLCVDDSSVIHVESAAATKAKTNGHYHLSAVGDSDIDTLWIFFAAVLVFWMQAGFAMLEAGSVDEKNVSNILFKNLMDASIGAIAFYLVGFAFAYGGDDDPSFIGVDNFALSTNGNGNFHNWFFQWAFAATAATIVSGAVAERCSLPAYFIYSMVLTAFIYPVVVHWCWDTEGWLSPFNPTHDIGAYGFLDFAGSGIVHMVGGFSGLVGAWMLGPREGRFGPNGEVNEKPGHSGLTATLGTAILWMGWYGFNGGSTLAASNGALALASKVATTTTLSAAAGALTLAAITKLSSNNFNVGEVMNGILAALVGITAPCAVVEPWAAIIIGVISGFVYYLSAKLLLKLKIDDVLNASPVHGFCGFWGVLATGIFSSDQNIADSYAVTKMDYKETGKQFGVQLVGGLVILAWSVVMSGVMFFIIKKTVGLRVSEEVEKAGLDVSEHGAKAFYRGDDLNSRELILQMTSAKTENNSGENSVEEKEVSA